MIRVLLADLDGVLRHFDAARMARIEREHGLEAGLLARTAFEQRLLRDLVTGRLSRSGWVDRVAGVAGEPARIWLEDRGSIDPIVWGLLSEMRQRVRVGVLTNGTDETRAELAALGLLDARDVLFVSAELGLAKPDAALFRTVAKRLGVEPAAIAFVDDAPENVAAARDAGWQAHGFDGADALADWLDGMP